MIKAGYWCSCFLSPNLIHCCFVFITPVCRAEKIKNAKFSIKNDINDFHSFKESK